MGVVYLIAIFVGQLRYRWSRLKELRTERNWTQTDLAQHVAVSRQTINAIEKGKFDPSLPLAFRLAKLFDLKIEEIFLDET